MKICRCTGGEAFEMSKTQSQSKRYLQFKALKAPTVSDRDHLGHLRVNSIVPTEESTGPLFFATIMCASMFSLYTNISIYYSALCHEQRIFL